MSGSFYKNVIPKIKMRTKMRRVRPNTGLQHVHLLLDNAPAPKSSTFLLYLSGKRYWSRSEMWSVVHQFLMGVPKDEYGNCFRNGLKDLNSVCSA